MTKKKKALEGCDVAGEKQAPKKNYKKKDTGSQSATKPGAQIGASSCKPKQWSYAEHNLGGGNEKDTKLYLTKRFNREKRRKARGVTCTEGTNPPYLCQNGGEEKS